MAWSEVDLKVETQICVMMLCFVLLNSQTKFDPRAQSLLLCLEEHYEG